jgi:amicyanin
LRKFSSVIALAAVLPLGACGSSYSAGAGAARHEPSPSAARLGSTGSPPASPSASPETATTEVTISDFAFHPASVTVKPGSTVNWTEEDADVHNVKFSGGGVTSPVLRKGETFSHTFNAAGVYPYICSIHPYMHGTVVVAS